MIVLDDENQRELLSYGLIALIKNMGGNSSVEIAQSIKVINEVLQQVQGAEIEGKGERE